MNRAISTYATAFAPKQIMSQKEIDAIINRANLSKENKLRHSDADDKAFAEHLNIDELCLSDDALSDAIRSCEEATLPHDSDDDIMESRDQMTDAFGESMSVSHKGNHIHLTDEAKLDLLKTIPRSKMTTRSVAMRSNHIIKDFVEYFGGSVYDSAKTISTSLSAEGHASIAKHAEQLAKRKRADFGEDGSEIQSFLIGYPLVFFFNLLVLVAFGLYPA